MNRHTGLPLIGSLFDYRYRKINFLEAVRDSAADLSSFRLGSHELILLKRPEDIHYVEHGNAKNFVKATQLRELVGDGILMSEGEKWRKQRRLIQPTFHQKNILHMVSVMNFKIEGFIEELKDEARQGPIEINFSKRVKNLAFEIVLASIFGTQESGFFETLQKPMEYINVFLTRRFNELIPFPLSLPFPSYQKFRKSKASIDSQITALIEMKRADIKKGVLGSDLMTQMILFKDPESGEPMDPVQLQDEVKSILLAGFETTAKALPWLFKLVCENPAVRDELIEEIRVFPMGLSPSGEEVLELEALGRAIDETLRLFPPVWAWTKRAIQEDSIRGVPIKAGAIFYLSPYLIHRDPKIWVDADQFVPSRWTAETRASSKQHYFPFGMGPRTCVGKHFALMEIRLITTRIFQEFDVQMVEGNRVSPDFQITLGMDSPLRIRLSRRLP
jgi:cytochrome P450